MADATLACTLAESSANVLSVAEIMPFTNSVHFSRDGIRLL